MKKILVFLTVCLSALFLLNSCGVSVTENNVSSSETQENNVELVSVLLNDNEELKELCEQVFQKDAESIAEEDFAKIRYLAVKPDVEHYCFSVEIGFDDFMTEYKLYTEQAEAVAQTEDDREEYILAEVPSITADPSKYLKTYQYSGNKPLETEFFKLLSNVELMFFESVALTDSNAFAYLKGLRTASFVNCDITDVSGFASLDLDKIEKLSIIDNKVTDWTPLKKIADKVFVDYYYYEIEGYGMQPVMEKSLEAYLYEQENTGYMGVDDYAEMIYASVTDNGGEYFEDAKAFCEALVNKDYETIAYYTGGKSEYYTFLDDCVIEECVLTPVSISAEKQQEIMEEENVYLSASDLYFLTLSITETGETEFVEGENICFLGFDMNAVSGNVLSFIVPAKDAEKVLFGSFERDYLKTFVSEFVSLYDGITDGRNDPSDFDFMNVRGVHLITHLMARSKVYREYPPYTLEEVNSFIMQSFENNNGIEFDDDRDYDVWINGQNFEDDRVYGCSYGHGGTTAKHRIMSVQNEGNSVTVNVTVYADYSNFAKAKDMVLYFEKLENGLLKLCGVEQLNNTGRSPAILSV